MKTTEAFLIMLIFIATVLLFYNAIILLDKKTVCVQNPLIYGAKRITKQNSADFSCTCFLDKPNSPTVYFDSNNMTVEFQQQGLTQYQLNFSKFDEMIPEE